MSEHEKSTRKKSMGAEKFHAFMKNKLAVAGAGLLIVMILLSALSPVIAPYGYDEQYYEEYKAVYRDILGRRSLPVLYNVNFGHALPRAALPYGARARVNAEAQVIEFI